MINQVSAYGWTVPTDWKSLTVGDKAIMVDNIVIPWSRVMRISLNEGVVVIDFDGFDFATIECGDNFEALDLLRYLFVKFNEAG